MYLKKIILPLILIYLFLNTHISGALNNYTRLSYTADVYPESNAYLDNPYEGFYRIYGYVLKDGVTYSSASKVPNLPNDNDKTEERLVQLQINLRNYADRPLSESALKQLDMILNAWSRTKYTVILRILYDWDGSALTTEPDNVGQILVHMEQTAEVYNKYADSIFVIQGLFTGNTGEMNHTNFGSKKHMKLLAQKLAEVSDPSIFLSVRTPSHWRSITGAESYAELVSMHQSPFLGRLGLYNDGMLGSESDTGTYVERSREEELLFQNELCRSIPNGGEVITDNPYNDLDNAIRDMRAMHVSYLNSGHDPAVISKWQDSVYHGDDVFDGVSGFDYIRDHLGYRYILRESRLISIPFLRASTLMLTIENAGFSASCRPFSFTLTLVDSKSGEFYELTPGCDSSFLPGSKTSVLMIAIDHRAYPPAEYELYWRTNDGSSGGLIRYGNDMELTEYGYHLGSLTLEAPYRRSE